MLTENPVDDRELTSALEDLVVRLGDRAYGKVARELARAIRGGAEAFIDTLACHLLFEEQVLFPAILREDEATAREVRGLLAEHGRLRKLAVSLERAVRSGRRTRGRMVGRLFLAELYAHIDRESQVTDRTCQNDPVQAAAG